MPIIAMHMRRGRPAEEKKALKRAVIDSLVTAFGVTEDACAQRIVEYAPEDFDPPPHAGEGYVLVEILSFPGRHLDSKRLLYRTMVDNFAAHGVERNEVAIVIKEQAQENWGIHGGRAAEDIFSEE